jgi:hypothetical protein
MSGLSQQITSFGQQAASARAQADLGGAISGAALTGFTVGKDYDLF